MISKKNLYGALDQALVSGGSFISFLMCARFLSLGEQGTYVYVMSAYLFVLLINIGAIYQAAPIVHKCIGYGYLKWLGTYQLLVAILQSVLISTICMFFGEEIGWSIDGWDLVVLLIYLFLQQLADFDRRIGYVSENSSYPTISSGVVFLTRLGLLALIQPVSVVSVLLIYIASCAIPATKVIVSSVHFFFKRRSFSYRGRSVLHLRISLASTINAPVGWMLSYAPLYILGLVSGPSAVAVVSVFKNLTNFTNVIMEQIETRVISEWIQRKHSDSNFKINIEISKFALIGFLWIIFVFALLVAWHQDFTKFLLGEKYISYSWYLIMTWVAYGFYFISRIFGIKLRLNGAYAAELFGGVIGVLFCFAVGYFVISKYEELGALVLYIFVPIVVSLAQMTFVKLKM